MFVSTITRKNSWKNYERIHGKARINVTMNQTRMDKNMLYKSMMVVQLKLFKFQSLRDL